MTRDQIITTIHQFLEDDFEVPSSKLHAEANLKETLDLDSLDYVDLVVSIESNFGFKVKPDDFQQMVVMNDFYNYVESKIGEKINN